MGEEKNGRNGQRREGGGVGRRGRVIRCIPGGARGALHSALARTKHSRKLLDSVNGLGTIDDSS